MSKKVDKNANDIKTEKAIIMVYGKDKTGIIYHVCKVLYENSINVLDIKQTILDGFFNMLMVVDISRMTEKTGEEMYDELNNLGKELDLSINFQLEKTFTVMHQI